MGHWPGTWGLSRRVLRGGPRTLLLRNEQARGGGLKIRRLYLRFLMQNDSFLSEGVCLPDLSLGPSHFAKFRVFNHLEQPLLVPPDPFHLSRGDAAALAKTEPLDDMWQNMATRVRVWAGMLHL